MGIFFGKQFPHPTGMALLVRWDADIEDITDNPVFWVLCHHGHTKISKYSPKLCYFKDQNHFTIKCCTSTNSNAVGACTKCNGDCVHSIHDMILKFFHQFLDFVWKMFCETGFWTIYLLKITFCNPLYQACIMWLQPVLTWECNWTSHVFMAFIPFKFLLKNILSWKMYYLSISWVLEMPQHLWSHEMSSAILTDII